MRKRMVALLLCTVLALTLLPGTALANNPGDSGGLKITLTDTGTPATKEDHYTYDPSTGEYEIIRLGNYTVSMKAGVLSTSDVISTDASDGPVNLTLDNVTIKREGTATDFADGPLFLLGSHSFDYTLTLKGANSLTLNNLATGEEYDSYVMAVYADSDRISTIQGDGSLAINAEGTTLGGIWLRNKLLIKSGNITINSDQHGIYSHHSDA